MKKILVPYLILMLTGGFVYAQDSDSEDGEFYDYSSDDASYESAFEESFREYRSVVLCLPLQDFPRGGVFAPHFVDEYVEQFDVDGVLYEQRVQQQEPLDGVGPLNPLTTLLHIQGVHGVTLDAPIIFFAQADVFEGQIDRVNDMRMTAVGPVYFGEGDYVVVPDNEDYTEETTGFQGTLIPYNPNETTAREALNQWLLDNEGWYAEAGGFPELLQVVGEGGEVITSYDARELNRFWANEHGLHFGVHEDSVFAKIETLVQRVFWRFYRPSRPEAGMEALWQELMELLDELIEEDEWDDVARGYLGNYRTLLAVWRQAYDDPRIDAGRYVPPSLPVNRAFGQIDALLYDAEDPSMWPTGRVTVFEDPIPLGEPVLVERIPVFEVQVLDVLLRQIANEVGHVPVDTLLGAKECWF